MNLRFPRNCLSIPCQFNLTYSFCRGPSNSSAITNKLPFVYARQLNVQVLTCARFFAIASFSNRSDFAARSNRPGSSCKITTSWSFINAILSLYLDVKAIYSYSTFQSLFLPVCLSLCKSEQLRLNGSALVHISGLRNRAV